MFHFAGSGELRRSQDAQPARSGDPYFLHKSARLERVQSESEFSQILRLRYECYVDAEKVLPGTGPEAMRSDWDARAEIYAIRLADELVGTIRVFIPQTVDDKLENIDHALGYYPSNLPPKSDVIEMSHLCLKPGYRRSDLTKSVFALGLRVLAHHQRSTILISSDSRLKSKYRFMGFKDTGHIYRKPRSQFSVLTVMSTNLKPLGFHGLHVDPIRWNIFLRDMTDELIRDGVLKPPVWVVSALAAYRLFAWTADALERMVAYKNRSERLS